MAMRLTLPLFASLAAASVGSQSPQYISPTAAATAFGSGQLPLFDGNAELALQQVHDPETFSPQTAGVLNRLRLRPLFASNVSVELEVTMAFAPARALAASAVFANNLEPVSTAIVIPRQTVQLPMVANRSWTVSIPFSRPFPFPGTLPITWQLRSALRSPLASYLLEAWSTLGSDAPNGTYRGCHSLHLVLAQTPAPGGHAYYYAEHNSPATGPAA